MDNPITDREKAAVVFFFTLMQRMIVDEKLRVNFYIPISKCDENFSQAIIEDSMVKGRFWFRRYFCEYLHGDKTKSDEMVKLSVEELLVGNSKFDGLKRLIQAFVELNKEAIDEKQVWEVFSFYVVRSRGKLLSNAGLLRKFVKKHKLYQQDSVISPQINTDLINFIVDIRLKDHHQELIGDHLISLT